MKTDEVTRVTITLADGQVKTFDVTGHYTTRLNAAQSKSYNGHLTESDEQAGQWIDHEVWWRVAR